MKFTQRDWTVIEAVVTVALVLLLAVGLYGFEFRWLGMPFIGWLLCLSAIAVLIDRARIRAKSTASKKG